MIKSSILTSLFALITLTTVAQNFEGDSIYYTPLGKNIVQKATLEPLLVKNARYFFAFQSGALMGGSVIGEKGMTTFSFATTHGVRLGKRFGVGVGAGFDSYFGWKALPLFGSVSFDVLGKKNKVFVQVNYGGAWVKKAKSPYEYGATTYDGGRMINPSVGYKIVYGDVRLYIQVGYKLQRITMNSEYPSYFSYSYSRIAPLPNSSFSKTELSMNRAYFSIGFGWR